MTMTRSRRRKLTRPEHPLCHSSVDLCFSKRHRFHLTGVPDIPVMVMAGRERQEPHEDDLDPHWVLTPSDLSKGVLGPAGAGGEITWTFFAAAAAVQDCDATEMAALAALNWCHVPDSEVTGPELHGFIRAVERRGDDLDHDYAMSQLERFSRGPKLRWWMF